MKFSNREMGLISLTGLVALLAVTFAVYEPRVKEWRTLRRTRAEMRELMERCRRVVSGGPKWETNLQELRKALPQYPAEKNVTADLLNKIEELAKKNGVDLTSRSADKEKQHGDFCELAIACSWEGSRESMVHLLFDLHKEGVILDLRQLRIAPTGKGRLQGSFRLNCVYEKIGGNY